MEASDLQLEYDFSLFMFSFIYSADFEILPIDREMFFHI